MIALLALSAAPAAADAVEKPPPTPHAEVRKLEDATIYDLRLDGPVLSVAVLRRGGESRRVLVLAGPPRDKGNATTCAVASAAGEAPRRRARLFSWDMERPEVLLDVGRELPEGMIDVVDLDGDGRDEGVIFGDTGIDELLVDMEARTTTTRPLVAGSLVPVQDPEEIDPALRAVSIGALTTYGREADGAGRPTGEVELPIQVYRRSDGVHVRSSSLRAVGRLADGRVRLVSAMERIPDLRRVRMTLLDPEGSPESRAIEAWGRFPSRERALEEDVVLLDGAPVLVVMTTPADKLSFFGEKLLRVFPLAPDRTRAGHAPLLALETGINLWQGAVPRFLDLDGDRREELVLVYWKGIKDAIAALEVRPRLADGSFGRPRTFDFDVPGGDKGWTGYGTDLDGDGRPDLALRAEGSLLVYPGSPADHALDRPVTKVPSRRVPLPEGTADEVTQSVSFGPGGLRTESVLVEARRPRFVDLDGDGRVEAIFAGGSGSSGRVAIVRFR